MSGGCGSGLDCVACFVVTELPTDEVRLLRRRPRLLPLRIRFLLFFSSFHLSSPCFFTDVTTVQFLCVRRTSTRFFREFHFASLAWSASMRRAVLRGVASDAFRDLVALPGGVCHRAVLGAFSARRVVLGSALPFTALRIGSWCNNVVAVHVWRLHVADTTILA